MDEPGFVFLLTATFDRMGDKTAQISSPQQLGADWVCNRRAGFSVKP